MFKYIIYIIPLYFLMIITMTTPKDTVVVWVGFCKAHCILIQNSQYQQVLCKLLHFI